MPAIIDLEHLQTWIGKEACDPDVAGAGVISGLAALLDYEGPPWPDVPPLGHWLYFLPKAPQSQLSDDGHPRRGGFMPPVPLERRMWAGGALRFLRPLKIGTTIERRSTIRNVEHKAGANGDLLFVTLDHEVRDADDALCIEERQDIVYRGPSPARTSQIPEQPARSSDAQREVRPDPVLLFRFSALTFNSHRIHYDRDYARNVEGYPGLVVPGPLTATFLVDHFLREMPGTVIASFEFRACRPLFEGRPFTLHLRRTAAGAELWATDFDGQPAMTARIETSA